MQTWGYQKGERVMKYKKGMLFCEISPFTYKISMQKEIVKRHIKNLIGKEKFAKKRSESKLPNVVSSYSSNLIKRAPGIDITLQVNKAVNIEIACSTFNGLIIHPGETFSFWKLVGNTTKRKGYMAGRVLVGNKLVPGLGGGLCNLSNTLHLLVINSPLKVTEFHKHSDALAPDEGKRVPFGSGTSVSYNNLDYRFVNNTDQDIQLCAWCQDEKLYAELRSEREFPNTYEIVEENHHFALEGAKYYRISKIYKVSKERESGEIVSKELILDNHSEVMYDYSLIPKELIKK